MLQLPLIQLSNVTKTFRTGDRDVTVLHDISLTIEHGESVAIVGASGNGKSTLLNMITGIDRPTSGSVTVNGTALHRLSENQMAVWRGPNIGIVFQFFQLLPSLTLLQNVILPMELVGKLANNERRQRAEMLLEQVGLSDQMHKLPGMVSGGQQQRAAIARALANDAPLLVADEPTGNLDAATSEEILALFDDLHQGGRTLVMVTHSHDLAERAERVLSVVNGRIDEDRYTKAQETIPPFEPELAYS